jgi:hypothetical protein
MGSFFDERERGRVSKRSVMGCGIGNICGSAAPHSKVAGEGGKVFFVSVFWFLFFQSVSLSLSLSLSPSPSPAAAAAAARGSDSG